MDFYVRYDRIDRLVRRQGLLSLYYYSDSSLEVVEVRSFKVLTPYSSTSTPSSWKNCSDSSKSSSEID